MTVLSIDQAPEFWNEVPKAAFESGRITNIGQRLRDFVGARIEQLPEQDVMTVEVPEVLTLPPRFDAAQSPELS